MELRLSELLQCMYVTAVGKRRITDNDKDSTIEVPASFNWNGKKGKLTFIDGYTSYNGLYCRIEIGDKTILSPLMDICYKYRFRKPIDIYMSQEGTSDREDYAFPLAIYLMVTGIFTAEEIKNKIIFKESSGGKTSVKASNKDGQSPKFAININFEDENWAKQLQTTVLWHHAVSELYEIAKHLDSLFEFLNSAKLEVNNHDCYDMLPRDLYLIDDYTFEDYISSGDYLTITSPIEDTDLYQAERDRQAAIDSIDKASKFQYYQKEGEVSAKELLTNFKNQTLTYVDNTLEENEEVRERLEDLSDVFEETPEDVIPYLFEDFWDEVEKYLQKDLKKFPYPEDLSNDLSKKVTDYLDYLKDHAKRLNVYIEDLEDAILELDMDDIVE